jgi:hypothetical protein
MSELKHVISLTKPLREYAGARDRIMYVKQLLWGGDRERERRERGRERERERERERVGD